MNSTKKKQIANSFSQHATSYDRYATLQKKSAGFLLETLEVMKDSLPPGPILEIGCGSGVVSIHLAENLTARGLVLMDIAPGMIHECRDYLQKKGQSLVNINFVEMDAETIEAENHYALVVSGLTIQWFTHLQESILKIYRSLAPGGVFVFSFLGNGSFPEWVEQCAKSHLSCTLNPLPDSQIINDLFHGTKASIQHWQKDILLHYASVKDFFLSLKRTGAGVSISKEILTVRELNLLMAQWEREGQGEISVTCKVHYFAITRS